MAQHPARVVVSAGPGRDLTTFAICAWPPQHDVQRDGVAVLVAAVPDTDPAAPWRLAGEEPPQPARFDITMDAFGGTREMNRDSGAVTMNGMLLAREAP